jgi:uncharacterized protein YndB with AHSA1/START domain
MRVPMGARHATNDVHVVVEIAAPPEAVFHALSDPHELAAWLGGEAEESGDAARCPMLEASSHPMIGQPWRAPALGPDGSPGTVQGEYLLVDPPRCLESTWRASWDGFAPDKVRFELTPVHVGGVAGTKLTVIHTCASAQLRVTAQSTAFGQHQWSPILARLAAYVAAINDVAQHGALHDVGGSGSAWYDDLHNLTAAIRRHQGE